MSAEPFRVLTADNPWLPRDKLPGKTRGASKRYPCMPTRDLCRLNLPPLAKDCVLFLWRLSSMPQDALDVVRAWGFTPKSELVWAKTTRARGEQGPGRLAFGMGRSVRAAHETCIIATRGRVKPLHMSQRSVFFADRGEHSEKPDEFFSIVEGMYAGPYCELFARRERAGWTTLGDAVGHHITSAT